MFYYNSLNDLVLDSIGEQYGASGKRNPIGSSQQNF
jgi:hypothetical protein